MKACHFFFLPTLNVIASLRLKCVQNENVYKFFIVFFKIKIIAENLPTSASIVWFMGYKISVLFLAKSSDRTQKHIYKPLCHTYAKVT